MRQALGSLHGTTLGPRGGKPVIKMSGKLQRAKSLGDWFDDIGLTQTIQPPAPNTDPWNGGGNPVSALIDGVTAGVGSVVALAQSTVSGAPTAADNITQTADGSGSITTADFKNVGGVCMPMNIPASNFARAMQAQMNRVAQGKGMGKIGVDGKIGPRTMALFAKISAAYPNDVSANTTSCAYIAADADVWATTFQGIADSLGVPAQVSAPASAAATIVTKSGKTVLAPPPGASAASVTDAFSGMSSTQKIMFAGVVGGVGYLLLKGKKKRKGG